MSSAEHLRATWLAAKRSPARAGCGGGGDPARARLRLAANHIGTLAAILCLLAVTGCRQKMATQPAYRPLRATTFFRDGLTARPPVPGAIARGELDLDGQ